MSPLATSGCLRMRPDRLFSLSVLLVLVVFSTDVSSSPTCVPATPTMECAETPYEIFINTTALSTLDYYTRAPLALTKFENPMCQSIIRPFVCGMFLPECQLIENQIYPRQICRSYCEQVKAMNSSCPYSAKYLDKISCTDPRYFDQTHDPASGLCSTMDTFKPIITVSTLGTCVNSTGTQCQNVRAPDSSAYFGSNFPVYVPYGASIGYLDATVHNTTRKFNLLLATQYGEVCANQLYRLTCFTAYRRCQTIPYILHLPQSPFGNLTTVIPVGLPVENPCHSMCVSSKLSCIPLQSLLESTSGGSSVNCEETNPVTKTPLYQPDHLPFTPLPGVSYECSSATDINQETSMDHIPCISPLLYEKSKDPVCQKPCRLYLFDETTTDKLATAVSVLAHLSFFLDLFLVITLSLFKIKRQFPNNLAWFCAIGSTIVALAIVMGYWIGTTEAFCEDSITPYETQKFCALQGFMILNFGLSTVMWWFALILTIFLTVVMGNKQTYKYEKYYHVLCWGVPVLLSVVAAGVNYIGYDGVSFWCLYQADVPDAAQFGLFYGWIGVMIFFGSIMVGSVIFKIIKVTRAARGNARNYRQYFRLVALCCAVMFVFVFIFSFRFHMWVVRDGIEESVAENVRCRGSEFDSECPPVEEPSMGLWILGAISPASQGIVLFLFFGLTQENFALWKGLLQGNTGLISERLSSKNKSTGKSGVEMERLRTSPSAAASGFNSASKTASKGSTSRADSVDKDSGSVTESSPLAGASQTPPASPTPRDSVQTSPVAEPQEETASSESKGRKESESVSMASGAGGESNLSPGPVDLD